MHACARLTVGESIGGALCMRVRACGPVATSLATALPSASSSAIDEMVFCDYILDPGPRTLEELLDLHLECFHGYNSA